MRANTCGEQGGSRAGVGWVTSVTKEGLCRCYCCMQGGDSCGRSCSVSCCLCLSSAPVRVHREDGQEEGQADADGRHQHRVQQAALQQMGAGRVVLQGVCCSGCSSCASWSACTHHPLRDLLGVGRRQQHGAEGAHKGQQRDRRQVARAKRLRLHRPARPGGRGPGGRGLAGWWAEPCMRLPPPATPLILARTARTSAGSSRRGWRRRRALAAAPPRLPPP